MLAFGLVLIASFILSLFDRIFGLFLFAIYISFTLSEMIATVLETALCGLTLVVFGKIFFKRYPNSLESVKTLTNKAKESPLMVQANKLVDSNYIVTLMFGGFQKSLQLAYDQTMQLINHYRINQVSDYLYDLLYQVSTVKKE